MRTPLRRIALVLAALATAASGTPASAQTTVGLRASGLYSAVSRSDAGFDLGNAWGVGAGAFADVPLSPVLALVTDLGYTQVGVSDEIRVTTPGSPDVGEATERYRVRSHRVTLAPALAARLVTGTLEPYAFAGLRLDVELAERASFRGESTSGSLFDPFSAGVSAGLGVDAGRLRADLRGSYLAADGLRQRVVELRVGVEL